MAVPLPTPPPTLVGAVTLRALADEDWPVEQELSADPDVVRWTFYPADLSEEHARERIARGVDASAKRRAQRYVVLAADGQPLGTCGLGALGTEAAEIFYALLPRARGRGAATEATRLLADWVLSSGYRYAVVVTVEGNDASEAVAARAGFTVADDHEGEHRGRPVTLRRWVRYRPSPAESERPER